MVDLWSRLYYYDLRNLTYLVLLPIHWQCHQMKSDEDESLTSFILPDWKSMSSESESTLLLSPTTLSSNQSFNTPANLSDVTFITRVLFLELEAMTNTQGMPVATTKCKYRIWTEKLDNNEHEYCILVTNNWTAILFLNRLQMEKIKYLYCKLHCWDSLIVDEYVIQCQEPII